MAGVGFGLAANVRPEYLPALAVSILVAAALPYRPWEWRRRGIATVLVVAGALATSLPQILINHRHHDTWSAVVPGGRDIAMMQLTDGFRAQKYETYVGEPAGYPQPEVFYLDPPTLHVLDQEYVSEISSYGQYARIVVPTRPSWQPATGVTCSTGWMSGYPAPYIRNLDDTSIVLSLLQYTLMFMAIARLLLPDARRALGRIRWAGIVVLLSPCLTAIPGAVEPRFFLPVQMLIYMLVCFGRTRGRPSSQAASGAALASPQPTSPSYSPA